MPVLCTRFLQPQLVPLFNFFIKGPVPALTTNIIILCGVSVIVGVLLCLVRRKYRNERRFGGLAGSKREQPYEIIEDHERRLYTKPTSPSWPSTTSKVKFEPDTGDRQQEDERTITTMSEAPQNENLELQRRKSYTSKVASGVDELNGEIVVAEGWRRHTRVFGGGKPCQACEESERMMREMNLKLQTQQPREAGLGAGKPPAENASQEKS